MVGWLVICGVLGAFGALMLGGRKATNVLVRRVSTLALHTS